MPGILNSRAPCPNPRIKGGPLIRTPRYITFTELLYTHYIARYRAGIPIKGPSFCPLTEAEGSGLGFRVYTEPEILNP